jgi:NADH:ubiquinone oxidoreductase subunit F (NADH-binding)
MRTNSLSSDQTVTVKVAGRVQQPGLVVLPKGTTLLEALIVAGGFDEGAAYRNVVVAQSGKRHLLKLQQKNDWRSLRCFAWYGEKSDFLLEAGAEIEVRFWPPAVRQW